MLISFKVSNFLSFKEETEFSMVAGKERIHPHHVIKGKKNQPNLLRSALVYGANAAGKSNFVKAIDFAKWKILYSGKLLITDKDYLHKNNFFKLGDPFDSASKFQFEFVANENIYIYSFKDERNLVLNEKLIKIENGNEILLFERVSDYTGETEFKETIFLKKTTDKEFLKFVQRSTKADKLFLTHCAENNVLWTQDAFNWFQNSLETVFPETKDSKLEERIKDNNYFKTFFTDLIKKAGTGVSSVDVLDLSEVWAKESGGYWSENDNPISLSLYHGKTLLGKEEESDGTQRLFDLAFPFYDLAMSETPKVYIIDELERNLHTNLSYMLLKSYLEQDGKGQLIATTHDTHLLDLDLLRRDEIWFAEKDEHGATQMYSLYEFNPRYDKKIEKEYLTGRFGAIPFLGNLEFKRRLAKNGKSKNNGES